MKRRTRTHTLEPYVDRGGQPVSTLQGRRGSALPRRCQPNSCLTWGMCMMLEMDTLAVSMQSKDVTTYSTRRCGTSDTELVVKHDPNTSSFP